MTRLQGKATLIRTYGQHKMNLVGVGTIEIEHRVRWMGKKEWI